MCRTELDQVMPWRERVPWNGVLRGDTILPKGNNKKQRSARVHVAQWNEIKSCERPKSIFEADRYCTRQMSWLCVFWPIWQNYSQDILSHLLTTKTHLWTNFIAAGCGWKQGVSCSPNCGEIMGKGRNGRFFADTGFVKWIRRNS